MYDHINTRKSENREARSPMTIQVLFSYSYYWLICILEIIYKKNHVSS